MYIKKALFFLCFLPLAILTKAQSSIQDTIISIDEIEVATSRLNNFALGTTINRLTPEVISKNNSLFITDIFSSFTGISVKTYGLGGLSTLSMRGGGASHTAVLWNGLNIQNPMSGLSNLSTIPAFLTNEITIQQGGSGTLYGSGAVGGIVHISTIEKMDEKNNVTFQAGYGSFNKQNLIFTAKTGDSIYAFSLKIFKQSATNDFPFTNTAQIGNPSVTQTNAGMRNYGLMPSLQLATSQRSLLSISALYQKYSKDMQTIMTDTLPNHDNQSDENVYISANWKIVAPKYSLSFKSGLFKNRILLLDKTLPEPEDEPISKNTASSFIFEGESKIYISEGHILNAGLNFTNETGESLNYLESVSRSRFSLFSSYKIIDLVKGLNSVLSLRSEFENGEVHPVTFSLGTDYQLNNNIQVKGNISRNYRVPAFNDLYWGFDGIYKGNPELKPESGFSGELGLNENLKAGIVNLEFSQTAFATIINDWIVWLSDSSNIWSPENNEKGKSSGFELRGKSSFEIEDSEFDITGFYTFTNAKTSGNGVYSENQMIYVPKHRFMASINYSYKNFSTNFNFNHVSERFYDQTSTLDAYQIGNLVFHYNVPFGDSQLRASFRINNIWDTEYQSIALYAMPKRNFHLALNLRINTKY